MTLKIYNALEQLLKTLIDEEQTSGYYSIIWNGKNEAGKKVTSGVYLYQLRTGDYVKARKMVLIR